MKVREMTEDLERKTLSPYAVLSLNTKGRLRKEKKCEIRTDFQRDRDRIIHSKAFRRLKHKTQVFIAPEFDHYRTRLTHTLEVDQIARTIARALRLNEDLAEAIALGHDLGHTPFGHAGEEILNEICQKHDKALKFRHNEQSLRVVDVLEREGKGLNLTWEVRDGILSHSKGEEDIGEFKKGGGPSTLEGEVVRIADRVAYVNHDIDDALRARIITEKDLPEVCRKVLGNRHTERISTMVKDIIKFSQNSSEIKMSEKIGLLTNKLKDFLYDKVYFNPLARNEDRKVKGVLESLFDFYMANPFGDKKRAGGKPSQRARIVCDYVAGMTDRYALLIYQRLFLPQGWRGE